MVSNNIIYKGYIYIYINYNDILFSNYNWLIVNWYLLRIFYLLLNSLEIYKYNFDIIWRLFPFSNFVPMVLHNCLLILTELISLWSYHDRKKRKLVYLASCFIRVQIPIKYPNCLIVYIQEVFSA